MTTLRFVGDLPAWLGIILAVLGAVLACVYYRRESFDLPNGLRWLLPCLRALAIWMVIVILTGPVLHHRKEIGQLGSVRLLVDASQSMTVPDPQMPLARKLRIAQDHGWLPEGQFDSRLSDLSERIAGVRQQILKSLDGERTTQEQASEVRKQFIDEADQLTDLIATPVAVAADAANAATDFNAQATFKTEVLDKLKSLADEVIDDEEQARKIRDQLIATANKLQPLEQHYDLAFAAYCQDWLQTQGAAANAALQLFDQSLRIRRVESRLLDIEHGLVARLKDHHHIDIAALMGEEEVPIWNSRSNEAVPESLNSIKSAMRTDLASGLIDDAQAGKRESDDDTAILSAATVVFSDGQHNAGPAPTQIAGVARSQRNAIFTVGYGTRSEPKDLVLMDAEYPDTVHKTDRVRGTLVIKDRMNEGSPFVIQIADSETIVWQQELTSMNVAQRRVDFDFAVEPLVDAATNRFDSDVQHHSMPLELTAKIVPVDGETQANNNLQLLRFAAVTQRQKLLLIDSRSRWETRYLKNLFERDSGWEINSLVLESGTGDDRLQRGDSDGMFPNSKDVLFEYDLIIYGDVAAEVFNATEIAWLRDFVDKRGGGMIFIDGVRGELQRLQPDTLGVLLPVSWIAGAEAKKADRLELSEVGSRSAAMTLQGAGIQNDQFWQQLPAPHRVTAVNVLPGGEVLAEAVIGNERQPVIVSGSFGGGRIMYFAFDETWRWRYRVADAFHQRFWNQVARWAMPRPFAVSDQYLSLDSGSPRYRAGSTAPIRARLRSPDGNLVTEATVDALIWQDGRIVSTINLVPEQNMPGSYRAETAPLSPGDYEVTVRASGFNESAFQAKTGFVVAEPSNKEMEQIACNEGLLTDMAAAGGGRYLREEEVAKIVELLEPLSAGRVIESDTLLWQSWPWFIGIVGLLSVEWLLRKRSGLL